LVPGDILAIDAKMVLPCDCILLSGELLLNEASLTGESIPIPKFSLENDQKKFSFVDEKRSSLFEGTRVLSAKPTLHHKVMALVVRTGFASFKGQIFRSVLYPKP
jgi:cation-transporting ATPase 13A3/4/5